MNMVISVNKARQRLLRLSEAAEKLKRQAAISVRSGKENDARDLLLQKKKTMQALEKTKSRIELLDQLSTKLIEAISMRERQLVGTVALDLENKSEDIAAATIRVVSPPSKTSDFDEKDFLNSGDDQELQDVPIKYETESLLSSHGIGTAYNDDLINSLTSYEDFLDRIDENLKKVEAEVITAVKFSSLILENEESVRNVKVQQLNKILDDVRHVRQRIGVFLESANKNRDKIST